MRAMEQLNREVFKYREDQGILPPESYIADIKKNLEGWVRLGNLKYRARWISPEATDDEVPTLKNSTAPRCLAMDTWCYGLEPIPITRSIPKGSPMPAMSAKNVLNVEKTTPPSIFGLPPWPRTFRSAS
jgi:hypothetical protein